MTWLMFLLLTAATAEAQTYVKPYSLSVAAAEKVDQKIIGPVETGSRFGMGNTVSVSLSYRTTQDKVRVGIIYSHTIQNGANTVSAEVRYNVLQWVGARVRMTHAEIWSGRYD